jgi:hypothetical protein
MKESRGSSEKLASAGLTNSYSPGSKTAGFLTENFDFIMSKLEKAYFFDRT